MPKVRASRYILRGTSNSGLTNLGAGVSTFQGLNGNGVNGTIENVDLIRMPFAGVVRDLRIQYRIALGKTNTYTLMKNGVATALTISMGAADVEGSDLVNSVSVTTDDNLCFKITNTDATSTGALSNCFIGFSAVLIAI